MIDSRWVCKLTDFGTQRFKSVYDMDEETIGAHAYYARKIYIYDYRELSKNVVISFVTVHH